jgi:hypothetical protein
MSAIIADVAAGRNCCKFAGGSHTPGLLCAPSLLATPNGGGSKIRQNTLNQNTTKGPRIAIGKRRFRVPAIYSQPHAYEHQAGQQVSKHLAVPITIICGR